MQWINQLRHFGARFVVLPDHFIIHRWHDAHQWKRTERKRKQTDIRAAKKAFLASMSLAFTFWFCCRVSVKSSSLFLCPSPLITIFLITPDVTKTAPPPGCFDVTFRGNFQKATVLKRVVYKKRGTTFVRKPSYGAPPAGMDQATLLPKRPTSLPKTQK